MKETPDQESMPILVIEATGEIVRSNFPEFAIAARQWLANINRNLRTDEDFDEATANAKKAKEVEELLATTRELVLAKAETLNAELGKLSALSDEMRSARLELTRQIDKAKADQKANLIESALPMIECAPAMRGKFRPMVEAAVKGCKTMDSMREKVRVAIAIANDNIARAKRFLDAFEAEHGRTMTQDRDTLETNDPITVEAELRRRKEAAEYEAAAKKLRAEKSAAEAEAAKIKAEAEKGREALTMAPLVVSAMDPTSHPSESVTAPPEAVLGNLRDPAAEWKWFRGVLASAFVPVRDARAKLTDPENQAKAAALAAGFAAALAEVEKLSSADMEGGAR